MEVKTLLRLIREDIAHLEGITNEYVLESLPSSEEIELAQDRAKALVRELDLLHKITVQHENAPKKPGSSTKVQSEKPDSHFSDQVPFELFDQNIIEEKPVAEIIPELIDQVPTVAIKENKIDPVIQQAKEELLIRTDEVQIPETIIPDDDLSIPYSSDQNTEILEDNTSLIKKTLGETLGETHQLVNDILSSEKGAAGFQLVPIKSIWDGIGINDRFLFIRELFGNDSSNFESTITELDQLGAIQDAVNYLKMNFKWNKTEASQKFLVLVKRRFTK